MSAELKPCPFCGKQPRPKWYGASGEDDDSGYWGIDCCQAFSHEGTEAEAATAWNRRARSALAGDGETVREALEAAQVALSDWLVMYAADQCDAESVKQAIDRVGQYGTLAYITGVQQKIETALRSLSALPSPMPADSAALDEMARIAWFDEHNIGGSSDETPVDIWIGGNWLFAIPLGVLRKVRSAVTTRHGTAKPPMPVRGEITGEKEKWQAWAQKRLEIQRTQWLRAAKAALNGDVRDLRNRVELAEAPPVDVVLSESAPHD